VASGPEVGDPAPEFTLESTEGTIRLSERLARGAVLLVFYPGDETPVCTRQLCDYRDNLDVFRGLGVDVVAVNPQSLDSHREFAAKHDLPFPLCADEDRSVCRAYGATGLLGMTRRALFLVDREGRVRYRQVDLPVFRRKADELREVIEGLDLGGGTAPPG
jgi:peroxiredoxin Q/BCP